MGLTGAVQDFLFDGQIIMGHKAYLIFFKFWCRPYGFFSKPLFMLYLVQLCCSLSSLFLFYLALLPYTINAPKDSFLVAVPICSLSACFLFSFFLFYYLPFLFSMHAFLGYMWEKAMILNGIFVLRQLVLIFAPTINYLAYSFSFSQKITSIFLPFKKFRYRLSS